MNKVNMTENKKENILEKIVKTRLRRVAVFTLLWVCVWYFGYMYVWHNVDHIAGTYWAAFGKVGYFIALAVLMFLDFFAKKIQKHQSLCFWIFLLLTLFLYPVWGMIYTYSAMFFYDLLALTLDEFIIKIGELLHFI